MPKNLTSKIAVIGAGACGLSAAYYLSKKGIKVDVFESSSDIGGLGSSYQVNEYPVEKFVHHLFYSDIYFKNLINELGLKDNLHFKKSKDGIFINNKISPFSSALDLLRFSAIPLGSRLRTGLMAMYLKKTKNYKNLEKHKAHHWIEKFAGKESYEKIWSPLLISKFGKHYEKISMSWFWARVYSRTPRLGYLDGGYQLFFNSLSREIIKNNGKIFINQPVLNIQNLKNGKISIKTSKNVKIYDKVVVTIPPSVFEKITPELQNTKYSKNLKLKEMISATSLNLVLKKSFMNYYWLNITQKNFPFLVLVEHTKLVPTKFYKGKTILYVGNYLSHTDPRYTNSAEENLKLFFPYLKKINPDFSKSWIEKVTQHNALYAQPIVTTDYHRSIPSVKTPIKNLYLSTMSQIYPFDRGTNYAIREGKNTADLIIKSLPRK